MLLTDRIALVLVITVHLSPNGPCGRTVPEDRIRGKPLDHNFGHDTGGAGCFRGK